MSNDRTGARTMSSLKPCPQAEAIAQEIADNSGWSKRTDSYARIYRAALLGADRAFRAPIPVTDEMVERALIASLHHVADRDSDVLDYENDVLADTETHNALSSMMRAALTAALGGGNGNV